MAANRTNPRADERVAYAELATPIGSLRLYTRGAGVLAIALPGLAMATDARLRRLLGPVTFERDETTLAPALAQLDEYFQGTRHTFDLALDPRGTPFQRAVWNAVMAIPYGETRSYREIAGQLGRPAAGRAVGAANGANLLPPIVPCHRVIGANGALTGYAGGLSIKQRLLALERGQSTFTGA